MQIEKVLHFCPKSPRFPQRALKAAKEPYILAQRNLDFRKKSSRFVPKEPSSMSSMSIWSICGRCPHASRLERTRWKSLNFSAKEKIRLEEP